MARKSKNTGITKRLESEKTLLSTSYKLDIDNKAIYKGGMFPDYKNHICIIKDRSCKKHRKDYTVEFEDGKVINYVLESVLELYVENNENNINNNIEEESNNEN